MLSSRSLVTWFGAVLILSEVANCQGHADAQVISKNTTHKRNRYKELQEKLTANPIKAPPNSRTPEVPVNVNVTMILASLLYLDTRNEMFSVTMRFEVTWQDDALSWDVDIYPYKVILVWNKQVWSPPLAIANSITRRDRLLKSRLPMELYHDGTVIWFPGDTLTISCQVDIRYFPFDVQTCAIRVTQWVGTVRQAVLSKAHINLQTLGNNQWQIVAKGMKRSLSEETDDSPYWSVDYEITMKRQWALYTCTVIFPVVLVSGMNCVVFVLPVECGEKMSVSVTAFLTLTLFITIVQYSLPDNSDHLCYLAVYLSVQLTYGAMAVVLTALQVDFYHKDVTEGGRIPELALDLFNAVPSSQDDDLQESETTKKEEVNTELGVEAANQLGVEGANPQAEGKNPYNRMTEVRRILTHLAAEVDVYCFPVFVVLNVLSILTYSVVIASGPINDTYKLYDD